MLSHHNVGGGNTILSSCKRDLIQINSELALASALYSASVLDHSTMGCFLELQETRLSPRQTRNPLVDRLSETSPAQSTSLKDVIEFAGRRLNYSP